MAQEFSFDVVSKVDVQMVDNAVNTANREIGTRFDFKGSVSRMELDKKDNKLTLFSDNEAKLKSVADILQGRLVRQGVPLQALEYGKVEPAEGGTVRQEVKIRQGIASEKAKEIVRVIKDSKIKVTPAIQGDQLRVTARAKDDLQAVIHLLKSKDFGVPLQFANYR
ncbi:MAG: YajQ family cyclic di-GMP-binding protein [Elusimicrobia bacterium]|nr:YajQ family cyclic di-GMP-binding protein [Elusimicrobiota bacterium]